MSKKPARVQVTTQGQTKPGGVAKRGGVARIGGRVDRGEGRHITSRGVPPEDLIIVPTSGEDMSHHIGGALMILHDAYPRYEEISAISKHLGWAHYSMCTAFNALSVAKIVELRQVHTGRAGRPRHAVRLTKFGMKHMEKVFLEDLNHVYPVESQALGA